MIFRAFPVSAIEGGFSEVRVMGSTRASRGSLEPLPFPGIHKEKYLIEVSECAVIPLTALSLLKSDSATPEDV